MYVIGVRSLFQLLGLAQQAFKIRLGVCYLKKFHEFSLKYCVVLSTATNKVLGNWVPSANLDINLHIQESALPFRLNGTPQVGLLNDLWGPHPVIAPPCLPQADSSIYTAASDSFWGYAWPQGSISVELAGRWMARRKVREESDLVGDVQQLLLGKLEKNWITDRNGSRHRQTSNANSD